MTAPIYPLEQAQKVVAGARDYVAQASEALMALPVLWSAPEVPEVPPHWRGAPVVVLLGCYSGPLDEGERAIAPLRELGKPIADLSARMPWVEAQKFLDADYPNGRCYYWKSLYFERLDEEVIELLKRHTEARPSPLSSVDIWLLARIAHQGVRPAGIGAIRAVLGARWGAPSRWPRRATPKTAATGSNRAPNVHGGSALGVTQPRAPVAPLCEHADRAFYRV